MAMHLQKFKPDQLFFNANDTRAILALFCPSKAQYIKTMPVDDNQRALAQGLLIEAADANKKVELIKAIGKAAIIKDPRDLRTLKNLLETVAEAAEAVYEYRKHTAVSMDLINNSELDFSVLNTIRLKWRTEIEIVILGQGLSYLAENNLSNNISHLASIGINDPADNHQANDVMQFFAEYTSTEQYKNFEVAENIQNINALNENQQFLQRLETLQKIAVIFNQYRMFYHQKSDVSAALHYLTERLQEQQSQIFYIIEKNEVIAFMQIYYQFSSINLSKKIILNDLFVDEKYRGKGIAKALIQHLKAYAILNNYQSIELETAFDNITAQKLYQDLGFKLIAQENQQEIQNEANYLKYTLELE